MTASTDLRGKMRATSDAAADFVHRHRLDHVGLKTDFNLRTAEDGDWCEREDCQYCFIVNRVWLGLDAALLESQASTTPATPSETEAPR